MEVAQQIREKKAKDAKQKLKMGRVPGIDSITSEMIQYMEKDRKAKLT